MRVFASASAAALSALILLASGPSVAHAQAFFAPDGPVQLVTQSTFSREVTNIEKPVLAMFFAHWCGHCRNAAPEFNKAARSLDGIVKFAAIDCDTTENRDKCAEYGVTGYPTIKLFPATKRRVPRDYQGERKAQAFLDYAVEQLPLAAKKLLATELKPFLDKDPQRPKVILLSTKATSSPMFRSLALDFRTSHSFAYLRATDDAAHAPVFAAARTHLGLSDLKNEGNLPMLVYVKGGDTFASSLAVKYNGQIKYRQVKAWLDTQHDGTAPSAGKTTGGAKRAKTAAASAKKKASKAHDEEVIPEGGTVEWRARNVDADKRAAVEKLIKNAKAASSKLAAASSTASSAASEAAAKASASAEPLVKKVASKVQNTVETMGDTLVDAANSVADAAGAAADTATGAKIGEAIVQAGETVKGTLGKGGETIASAFGASKEAVQQGYQEVKDAAASAVAGDGLPAFDTVKDALESDHLLDSLASYLGEVTEGGSEGWKEQYETQIEQARKAAREALLGAKDKAAAQQMALDAEKWLLEAVQFDEDRLTGDEDDESAKGVKLTKAQKSKLNDLGKVLRQRIAAREAKAKAGKSSKATSGDEGSATRERTHDEL